MHSNDLLHNPLAEPVYSALNAGSDLMRYAWSESGDQELPSWFAVTDLSAAAIGAAGAEIFGYAEALKGYGARPNDAAADIDLPLQPPQVTVDRRLASLWFGWSIQPKGWEMPAPWDPIAGDYKCRDGWLKLHTNAPHHRSAALEALALKDHSGLSRENVAETAAGWDKNALERAVLTAGGCAAAMRDIDSWLDHPQGRALQQEPLIAWQHDTKAADGSGSLSDLSSQPTADQPLRGLKVLDLTRVLAGPVASRFLARFGANVLRIDPPTWEEPGVIPEVTLGKRCAGLDLKSARDRTRFDSLLKDADLLLHGYRPAALEGLGYSRSHRLALNPALIDVSLCAYGWTGPWAQRRGFDSLVQMSCGIADWGMRHAKSNSPSPLPVQALDHATGYLMAAAAVRALRSRLTNGAVLSAKLSLARTGLLLGTTRGDSLIRDGHRPILPASRADESDWVENTFWGEARRLRFPIQINGCNSRWQHPAQALRSSAARW